MNPKTPPNPKKRKFKPIQTHTIIAPPLPEKKEKNLFFFSVLGIWSSTRRLHSDFDHISLLKLFMTHLKSNFCDDPADIVFIFRNAIQTNYIKS